MGKLKLERSQIAIFTLLGGILLAHMVEDGWFYRHKEYTVDTGAVEEKAFIIGLDYTDTWTFHDDWLLIEISHDAPPDITIIIESTEDGRILSKRHHVNPLPLERKFFGYQVHVDSEIKEVKVTCISNSENNDAIVAIRTAYNYW